MIHYTKAGQGEGGVKIWPKLPGILYGSPLGQNFGVGRKYFLPKTLSKIISVRFIIITSVVKTIINGVDLIKVDYFCEKGQIWSFWGKNDVIALNFGVGRKYFFLKQSQKLW